MAKSRIQCGPKK